MQTYATAPSTALPAPIIPVLRPLGRDPGTPTLADILADPITRAVMRADRVRASDLFALRRDLRAPRLSA